MTVEHSVDIDHDPRTMIGMREFGAPREIVFNAWTDPGHLSQWGPKRLHQVEIGLQNKYAFPSVGLSE